MHLASPHAISSESQADGFWVGALVLTTSLAAAVLGTD